MRATQFIKGVAEGSTDTVMFEIDSENAYNHVMQQFGSVVDWDGNIMVAPRKYWGSIQELAYSAGGEATEVGNEQGMAEGGEGSGRHTPGSWDTTPGKVGRVEKTAQGIRHHADSSRYGGTEPDVDVDRLDKGAVNTMDKALGVKWDRESKKYFSPIKVDEVNNEKIGGRYDADEFDDMVARLKKLAGAGPMKTVYDPDRRVYRNMPTAQQPAQQPKKASR